MKESLKIENTQGIWKYEHKYPIWIPKEHQVTLGEGATPLIRIQGDPSFSSEIWVKREDHNPQGSHKDRALAYQVSYYHWKGYKKLTISSSGNGGISLAAYGQQAGFETLIFVHPQTPSYKLGHLLELKAHVILTEKPINFGRYVERRYGIPNLRPSTNPIATHGYQSLGWEIGESSIPFDSLFLFTTSGATLIGIYEAFQNLSRTGSLISIPAFHAVQGGGISSIASSFEKIPLEPEDLKKMGFLGAPQTPRKEQVLEILQKTQGRGWYIPIQEILEGEERLDKMGISTSLEGAACYICALKAIKKGWVKRPLVIFSGKKEKGTSLSLAKVPKFSSYNSLRLYLEEECSYSPIKK